MLNPIPVAPMINTIIQNTPKRSAGSKPPTSAPKPREPVEIEIMRNCFLSPPVIPIIIAAMSIPLANRVCTMPFCHAVPLKYTLTISGSKVPSGIKTIVDISIGMASRTSGLFDIKVHRPCLRSSRELGLRPWLMVCIGIFTKDIVDTAKKAPSTSTRRTY